MKNPIPVLLTLLALSGSSFAKDGWTADFDKGLATAKAEKKIALVDFTGSDWCSWCMKLDKEIFSTAAFKRYAKKNLSLVVVDFPQGKPLPKAAQEKNEALGQKYKVEGYPTVLVFNSEGEEIGKLGYTPGGPAAFIAELEKITKK